MVHLILTDAEVWTAINGLRAGADMLSKSAHTADHDNMPAAAEAFRQSGRAYRELADKLEEQS